MDDSSLFSTDPDTDLPIVVKVAGWGDEVDVDNERGRRGEEGGGGGLIKIPGGIIYFIQLAD